MKLCFSTLGCSERELSQILALASDFNIKALEIRGIGGELNNGKIKDLTDAEAERTISAFNKFGIAPTVLGTSCAFHSEERYEGAITEGKESILIASRLNIPYIRVFGNNLIPPEKVCYDRIIKGIDILCEFAKDKGVGVLLEVHGDFNTRERLKPITDSLLHRDNFGLIWDVGHTHTPYGDRWQDFYREMKGCVKHIHVKDKSGDKLTQIGKGDIPLRDILYKLSEDGFDGCISLEWERKWHPELEPIEKALAEFKKLFE